MAGGPSSDARSPALLPREQGESTTLCCSRNWPQFWAIVLLSASADVLGTLVLPGLATAYFNGGSDPCVGAGHESPACKAAIAKVASVGSSFLMLGSILAFVFSPLVGMLSDSVGRKPVVLFTLLLGLLKSTALLAVDMFGLSLYCYLGLSVITGAVPATIAFGLWITDSTRPSERVGFFALLAAATDLEAIVVPIFGAIAKTRTCLMVAVAFSLAAALLASCGFAESLPRDQRHFSLRPLQIGSNGSLIFSKKYRVLSFLVLLSNTVHAGCQAVYLIFTKVHFGATLQDVSPIMLLSGMGNLLVQVFVVKRLGACIGLRNMILVGYFFGSWNCLVMCLVPNWHWLYVLMPTTGLGVIFTPAIQALYMNSTSLEQRGAVQGALNSVLTLTSGLGPMVFSQLLVFFEEPRFGLAREATFAPYIVTICSNALCALVVSTCLGKDVEAEVGDGQEASAELTPPSCA